MDIGYINYKKKEYPVRISYYALKMFQKDTGISFEEMSDEKKEEMISVMKSVAKNLKGKK